MNALIICEESQQVCKAFRNTGIEAYSNDLIPCSGGHSEWHLQMDCYKAIDLGKWDIIIAHPPCTKLCSSGNRTYAYGKPKHKERLDSAKWTYDLWLYATSKCNYVCLENPKGVLVSLTNMPKPQYVHPYYFGDNISKLTGLFLHGLPDLIPTNLVEPKYIYYNSKRTKTGKSRYSIMGKLSSTNNKEVARLRSITYPGIAKAMAEQWSKFIIK